MNKPTGLKKGQILKNEIYSDSGISIEYDRYSYTLKRNGRYPSYYTRLVDLLQALIELQMKKSLSVSSLDIPVEKFQEITKQAVNEVQRIAGTIKFILRTTRNFNL